MTLPRDHHESYRGLRVAVLGATGFIGRWMARALCARGAQVSLVVRNLPAAARIFALYGIEGECVVGDLCDPVTVHSLLRQMRPTIVFNLAGYGVDRTERHEPTAYQMNVNLVRTLCEVMAEQRDPAWPGQDIVHVGSAAEYGESRGNLAEDSVPHPTTLYGQTKLAGTLALAQYCQTQALKGLTARLFTVYGPGEHRGRLLPTLWEVARTDTLVHLTAGAQQRDFTYVEDVADGLLRLGVAPTPPGVIVNLATGLLTSVRCCVETAARLWHIPIQRLMFGALPTRTEEMQHAAVTVERLRSLVGWVPATGLEEGMRRTADFAKMVEEE
jgi:UDP-glucose 4-epimerase